MCHHQPPPLPPPTQPPINQLQYNQPLRPPIQPLTNQPQCSQLQPAPAPQPQLYSQQRNRPLPPFSHSQPSSQLRQPQCQQHRRPLRLALLRPLRPCNQHTNLSQYNPSPYRQSLLDLHHFSIFLYIVSDLNSIFYSDT